MQPTIFVNLDDDLRKITAKLAAVSASDILLTVPKGSLIFADAINVRLLKKQSELLGKTISLQTMDERGIKYAEQHGIRLVSPFYKPAPALSAKQQAPSPVLQSKPQLPKSVSSGPVARPTISIRSVSEQPVARPVKTHVFEDVFHEGDSQSQAGTPKSLLAQKDVKETKKIWPKLLLVTFVIFCCGLVAGLLFYVLPEASIKVFPKTNAITRTLEMTAEASQQEADLAKLLIPATPVEQTYEKTLTFSSSGKKEVGTRSRGQVVVYNLTGNAISLKKNTTVLNVGSKLYYFDTDQDNIKAIPAKDANNPNAALPQAVVVVSQEGGDLGNIPAGVRMEITNQVFGSRPQTLYAKTVTPIEGGESRHLSVVSDDDISQAKKRLQEEILKEITEDLASQKLTLLDKAYIVDVLDFTTDKTPGTQTPNFEARIMVRVKLLAIPSQIIKDIMRDRIIAGLTDGQFLQKESKDTHVLKVKNYDAENKVLTISVDYSTMAYFNLPEGALPTDLTAKSVEAVQDLYIQNDRIDRVEIELRPQWQKKLPYFREKIKQEIVRPD